MNKYIKNNLNNNENIIIEGRKSFYPYTIKIFILLGYIISIVYLFKNPPNDFDDLYIFDLIYISELMICITVISIFIIPIIILATLFDYYGFETALTNKRILTKIGLLSYRTNEIEITKIESIKIIQSLTGRLLNFGTIVIKGTGSGKVVIRNISNPVSFKKDLNDYLNSK